MINEWTLYWITRLDAIREFLATFALQRVSFDADPSPAWIFPGLFIFILLLMTPIMTYGSSGEALKALVSACFDKLKPYLKWVAGTAAVWHLFCFLCSVGLAFVPDTKTALVIYGVPKLIRNQSGAIHQAEIIPEKLLRLLNQYLDKELEGEEVK